MADLPDDTPTGIWVVTRDAGRPSIFSRGWGSSARTDTHLTYMIDIALTVEFSVAAGGAR